MTLFCETAALYLTHPLGHCFSTLCTLCSLRECLKWKDTLTATPRQHPHCTTTCSASNLPSHMAVSTGGPTSTAWQRFLPTGPFALLPVRDGLANIVWSTSPEAAQALEQLSPTAFAAAANKVGGCKLTVHTLTCVILHRRPTYSMPDREIFPSKSYSKNPTRN